MKQRYFDDWLKWHRERGFAPIDLLIDDEAELGDYAGADSKTVMIRQGPARQYQTYNDILMASEAADGWKR